MEEKERVLYTQITWQYDGTISINSIVETVFIDELGRVVGVKPDSSQGINHELKDDEKPILDKLAGMPFVWLNEERARIAAAEKARSENEVRIAEEFAKQEAATKAANEAAAKLRAAPPTVRVQEDK